MEYTYILGNNLEKPLKYSYAAYQGKDFIHSWYWSRKRVLSMIEDPPEEFALRITPEAQEENEDTKIFTQTAFQNILHALLANRPLSETVRQQLDGFVKTFEVRKRLYPVYLPRFKPEDETAYHNIALYTTFACICTLAFDSQRDLRYLNALLKVNDTILSQWDREPTLKEKSAQCCIAYALSMELKFILDLFREKGIDLRGVTYENP